ncbi:MAG: MBL fold metallo-hydrolase [Albidovulum sp.]|nr:MBL fold metallo-hydrolase [Albidovulum sp.]
MKLVLLGTGTPDPEPARASSGFLVDFGTNRLQFDCGGGSFDRLLQAGYSPCDIDAMLLSHLHSDHMMDYARIVHARWDQGAGRVPDLDVYAPAPMAAISDKLFGSEGAFSHDLRARCEFPASREVFEMRGGRLPRNWPEPRIREISDGFRLEGDCWNIEAVGVPHAQPFLECLGFRLDSNGRSLVYSGDSGPSKALTELANKADILIHMCYQFSEEALRPEWKRGSSGHLEVAETAAQADVGTVILTHMRRHMHKPEAKGRIINEMSGIYGGRILIGEDLQVHEV